MHEGGFSIASEHICLISFVIVFSWFILSYLECYYCTSRSYLCHVLKDNMILYLSFLLFCFFYSFVHAFVMEKCVVEKEKNPQYFSFVNYHSSYFCFRFIPPWLFVAFRFYFVLFIVDCGILFFFCFVYKTTVARAFSYQWGQNHWLNPTPFDGDVSNWPDICSSGIGTVGLGSIFFMGKCSFSSSSWGTSP